MSPVQEAPAEQTVTLIDELLSDQRSLTAVQRFARRHEEHSLPGQARFYKDLIPFTQPSPGEQYAFEVDLDQCTGCKGCVTACHALNGLDDDETWRSVGLLIGGVNGDAMQQTVTTACHHCVDPGCLNGCPVLAYEKDPLTGIVRHLDDQCIGCQYCVMKCPYDVPRYSERLGIVRKCDLCHQRLSVGEAPACVQSCPNEAIKVTFVKRESITAAYRDSSHVENPFLAASPAPGYTLPATIYKTQRPRLPSLKAANESALRPQPAHGPLVFLLVLSQASVGCVGAAWLAILTYKNKPAVGLTISAAATLIAALGLAGLHLGRPLKAWRVFLGWRTSWFSREAIAFGGFLGAAVLASGFGIFNNEDALCLTLPVAVSLGIASVFCSFMLYVDTHREFWSTLHTGVRFAGSALLLGFGGWIVSAAMDRTLPRFALALLPLVTLIKLILEADILSHATATEWTPLKRTARLMIGPLRHVLAVRIACAVGGGIVLPVMLAARWLPFNLPIVVSSFGLLIIGELAERNLFFAAVSPTHMPGGPA